jgi:hypothetical protein
MISETTIETQSEVTPRDTSVYLVYPRRFYVLFVFSLLGFNQSLMWLTFSPIARNAEVYYNITVDTIDLLLNWGSNEWRRINCPLSIFEISPLLLV